MKSKSDPSAQDNPIRADQTSFNFTLPGVARASAKLYRSKWSVYSRFCRDQGIDPMDATRQHVIDFFSALVDDENRLVPSITSASTLQGYWAAIKSIYERNDRAAAIQGKTRYRYWDMLNELKDQPAALRRDKFISGACLRRWDVRYWQSRHGTAFPFPLTATKISASMVSRLLRDPKFLRDRAIARTTAFSSLSTTMLARLHVKEWDSDRIEVSVSEEDDEPVIFTCSPLIDALNAWLLTSYDETRPLFCKLTRSGELGSEPLHRGSIANIVKRFTGLSPTELKRAADNTRTLRKISRLRRRKNGTPD